ncbi:hypothetical protein ACFLUD_01000 [Chloroflexota bacterium]
MKKTEISPTKLKQIIGLRQAGSNWVEIDDQVKVERRVAKRVYEEWVADQEMRKRERIRFRFAAEAFHKHLEDLVRVARALCSYLGLPMGPGETKTAEIHLSNLWQQSILEEYDPYLPTPELVIERLKGVDLDQRLNEMVFRALQEHTKDNMRWQALDDWRNAWDGCHDLFNDLETEARRVLMSIIEKRSNVPEEIRGNEQQMGRTVVQAIWDSIVQSRYDPTFPSVKISFELVSRIAASGNKEVNDTVTTLYNHVIEDLLSADTLDLVQQLNDNANNARKAIDDLGDMLNTHKLYPLLLFTYCEFCPV